MLTKTLRIISRNASYSTKPSVKRLEDLANLKSLNEVDPGVIRQLIHQRTNELNVQQELEMVKHMSKEESKSYSLPPKITKSLWILAFGASSAYMVIDWSRRAAEYDNKEKILQQRIEDLETLLNDLLEARKTSTDTSTSKSSPHQVQSKWYERWFWSR
ncbi:Ina17p Ecym_7071 [Eremothecium cymbalariae DBVPG|uniref:Inner membrane assembly complex subunit 17 n=1 Tax=Eremothecium cymbalariae (strain CBS 270.75 / DBVPG 7215 / KCTC 17166 / NRRL Y-17582) TaxID=931890 RepID=G8JVQ9_ERECY|nr:hypothetical protein Ecym_7071 [Eremothecium cymbalariae DBVPG\